MRRAGVTPPELEEALAGAIADHFGHAVGVIVRNAADRLNRILPRVHCTGKSDHKHAKTQNQNVGWVESKAKPINREASVAPIVLT